VILTLRNYTAAEREQLGALLAARAGHLARIEIVVDDSESSLGVRLNRAVDLARGRYIAKMDDDDVYFAEYLWDMLLPFEFGDYALVGKMIQYTYLEGHDLLVRVRSGLAHRSIRNVAGATLVMPSTIARTYRFSDLNRGEDSTLVNHILEGGGRVYAADAFNFVVWRSSADDHTWDVDEAFFLERAEIVGQRAALSDRAI
jgi:glycosyltransferase involved in cell wall biosynthesis